MRKKLKKLEEERLVFTGIFERKGFKNGYKGPEETILLRNIRDTDDNLITDHLWFNYTKGFAKHSLTPGYKITFRARVKEYEKGYKGYREDVYAPIEIDYKLSPPTIIEVSPPSSY
jgi:hypothetical protein